MGVGCKKVGCRKFFTKMNSSVYCSVYQALIKYDDNLNEGCKPSTPIWIFIAL